MERFRFKGGKVMKKRMMKIWSCAAVMALVAVSAAGCGGEKSTEEGAAKETLKVAYVCNGTLGDKSFFDSAAEGIERIESELGVETKIIEAGFDKTKWQPALEDASDSDYDIIIVGTWEMQEPLEAVAPLYPDNRYIIFDTEMDYSSGEYDNVYSISYKYNEESFLAGALSAMVTTSDMELANEDAVIGFVGGIDSPVINDYLVGYIEGAKYVNDDIQVAYSYVGDFASSTKGKEMALAQYNNNKADIIFSAAGQAGLGAIDAAKEANRYAIGVDSDQAMIFDETDPEKADKILTSAVSNVGNSLFTAVEAAVAGDLEWGTAVSTGIADGTAELVDNEYYQTLVPEEFRNQITELKEKIAAGEIEISSAVGMESSELESLLESVAVSSN